MVRVPASDQDPTCLLAIRDEDPTRPWNPLGRWWRETHGEVVGVRDVRAGGAWLAADPAAGRLAVLLNRADSSSLPESELVSRGGLALDYVQGRSPVNPRTHGFNLVEIDRSRTDVASWDGVAVRSARLGAGTHMVAHDDVDDLRTPRIARWLDEFAEAQLPRGDSWWMPWIDILRRSTSLPSTDDRAIIRDNHPLGYPTQSLLICTAAVSAHDIALRSHTLPVPGHWDGEWG